MIKGNNCSIIRPSKIAGDGMSKMQYIKVLVDFDFYGKVTPVKIIWPDGREFEIDRILDVRHAPAKSGGSGMRYLCRIQHREVPIYFDDLRNRWWCDGLD